MQRDLNPFKEWPYPGLERQSWESRIGPVFDPPDTKPKWRSPFKRMAERQEG